MKLCIVVSIAFSAILVLTSLQAYSQIYLETTKAKPELDIKVAKTLELLENDLGILDSIDNKTLKRLIKRRKGNNVKLNKFMTKAENAFLLNRINENLSFLEENMKHTNTLFKKEISRVAKKLYDNKELKRVNK